MNLTYTLVIDEQVFEIDEPAGFDAVTFKSVRTDQHGFWSTWSEQTLEFACGTFSGKPGGAEVLRLQYAEHGTDAEVGILITCDTVVLFDGRLDFLSFKDLGDHVSCEIEETTYEGRLKARLKNTVNVGATTDVDGVAIIPPATVEFAMHTQVLTKSSEWAASQNSDTVTLSGSGAITGFFQGGFDGPNPDELEETYTLGTGFHNTPPPHDNFLVAEAGWYTINLFLDGVFNFSSGGSVDFLAKWAIEIAGVETNLLVDTGSGGSHTSNLTTTNTITKYLTPGQLVRVYAYVQIDSPGLIVNSVSGYLKAGSYLKITGLTEEPATLNKGYYIAEYLQGLAQANVAGAKVYSRYYSKDDTAGNPFTYTISDFYDGTGGYGSMRVIMDGTAVRGFPITGKPISGSLEKSFKSLQAIDNIGVNLERAGAEQVLRIEPVSRFYNLVEAISIPAEDVISFTREPSVNDLYNRIEVGYKKFESESLNGLMEFNTQREYATPLQKHEGTYTAVSEWVASGAAIETTRRKKWVKYSKEDTRYDKDTFVICVTHAPIRLRPQHMEGSNVMLLPRVVRLALGAGSSLVIEGGANAGTYTVDYIGTNTTINGVQVTRVHITGTFPSTTLEGEAVMTLLRSEQAGIEDIYGYEVYVSPLEQTFITAYNHRLSPFRMLATHLATWAAATGYYKTPNRYSFLSGEGEYTVQIGLNNTNIAPGTTAENTTITDGGALDFYYLIKPDLIRAKVAMTGTQYRELIDRCVRPAWNDPLAYGYIRIADGGTEYKTFLREYDYSPTLQQCSLVLVEVNPNVL